MGSSGSFGSAVGRFSTIIRRRSTPTPRPRAIGDVSATKSPAGIGHELRKKRVSNTASVGRLLFMIPAHVTEKGMPYPLASAANKKRKPGGRLPGARNSKTCTSAMRSTA
jgi:hypothetical protein